MDNENPGDLMTLTHETRIDAVFRHDPATHVRGIRERFERQLAKASGRLVLYGAGHYGRIALDALTRRGIRPLAFADRDAGKRVREIDGVPVVGPEHLRDGSLRGALVVVTVYNCIAVLKSLEDLGIGAITYAQAAVALGEPLIPYCGISDPTVLREHERDIRAAMRLWADDASRSEFLSQLEWSLTLDPFHLPPPVPAGETYFDSGFITLGAGEVFVDCGAFDGDSVAAFRSRCPDYSRIFAIEPDPNNRSRFTERFGGAAQMERDRIVLLPYATSDRRQRLTFAATGTAGSAVAEAGITVDAASLDELVGNERPTFVKMDIEGAEPDALNGARKLMAGARPSLAVCVYHDRRHLWQLPLLIAAAQPDYALRLRRYADECWELVCYATPRGDAPAR